MVHPRFILDASIGASIQIEQEHSRENIEIFSRGRPPVDAPSVRDLEK